ncbi:MAG: hypothetical protein M1822_004215 [Bathelium mastoideum]|nr:MAG: hypothetical protein M1822_004215 [Bathelium mastoideum]
MAQEIGKQGDIFKNAAESAVWLNSGGEDVICDICSWISTLWQGKEHSSTDQKQSRDFSVRPWTAVEKIELRRQLSVLISLPKKVPWTTSLWTLQESALRQDAIFHSSAGDILLHPESKKPLRITDLVYALSSIRTSLKGWLQDDPPANPDPERLELAIAAWDAVETTTFGRVEGANALQLLSASERRTCTRAHDRIYDIMNALGVSVPVDYTLQAEQVKEAMMLALFNTRPIEMQSFWQIVLPRRHGSWTPGEQIMSLPQLRQDLSSTAPKAQFSKSSSADQLTVSLCHRLTATSVDWLCRQIETGNGAWFQDGDLISNTGQLPNLSLREDELVNSRNFRAFTAAEYIAVVPLGQALPTVHLGPTFVYLLAVYQPSGNGIRNTPETSIRRVGLLFSKNQLLDQVDAAQGTSVTLV